MSYKLISLENFDPYSFKGPILNSPRSIEACKRQGIDPSELLARTLGEIKEMYHNRHFDNEGIQLMAKTYENRRKEKVKMLKEERVLIIEEQEYRMRSLSAKKGKENTNSMNNMSNMNEINTMHSMNSQNYRQSARPASAKHTDKQGHFSSWSGETKGPTGLDVEKRHLERLKQKQERDIEQIIEYETRMAEIRQKQDEKLQIQKQKEWQRNKELEMKRKEREAKQRNQELMKRKRAEEEERLKKEREAKEYMEQQERADMKKAEEKRKKREQRLREEETKRDQEEFKRQTRQKFLDYENKMYSKQQDIEEREKMRKEFLKYQNEQRRSEAEEKRKQHEEKLKETLKKNEDMMKKRVSDFEENQVRTEERKKYFELEMDLKRDENKRLAAEKTKQIKEVLDENRRLEDRKREEFDLKQAIAEEKQREADLAAQEERKQRLKDQKELDEKRKQAKQNMEEQLRQRTEGYLGQIDEKNERVDRIQKQKDDERRSRVEEEKVKRAEKDEEVKRTAKMKDFERERLQAQIQMENERIEKFKHEKENELAKKRDMRLKVEADKREIMEKFSKVKQGKASIDSVLADMKRPASATTPKQEQSRDVGENQKSLTIIEEVNSRKNFKTAQESKRRPSAQSSRSKPKSKTSLQAEKDSRVIIEKVKIRQNKEMLFLLEEEQKHEKDREKQLQALADPQERKRLEKIFAIERTRAHAKVQQLVETQENEIKELTSKYDI